MIVIPAVDLADGQCVRLLRGEMDARTVYSDDPAATARRWVDAGASILHVVDLDGAVQGNLRNRSAVEAICREVTVPVELGGGLRTRDDVQQVLDLGVHWAIMGTSALEQPQEVERALAAFGGRLIISIDARDGFVATRGWTTTTHIRATELAGRMEALGAQRFICTDIASDGALTGPNLEGLRELAQAVSVPLIAAGGVSCLADIVALKALEPLGLLGCITGKAIYEGRLDLAEAIRVAASASEGAAC